MKDESTGGEQQEQAGNGGDPLEVLVLGGTAFLGRAVAAAGVRSGHHVTCLARGNGQVAAGAVLVRGDRDREDGLAPVTGRHWDAVVDVTRHPVHVRRALAQLDTDYYVFVSTGNVYAGQTQAEQMEDARLVEPLAGEVMESDEDYGPAKVACERLLVASPIPSAVLRAGLIGGPGDTSARSGYYPWRFAHPVGQQVVVPDDPEMPVALIDVRDLADWIVHLAETRTAGVFNAAGPPHTLGQAIAWSAEVAASDARPLPVTPALLNELGVGNWMGPCSLPLWISDPEWREFALMDTTRARAAGLVSRPFKETLAGALDYENHRSEPRRAGLSDEDEARVQRAVAD